VGFRQYSLTLKAILEEVADATVLLVERGRKPSEEFVHPHSEVGIARLQNQVKVIRHQREDEDFPLIQRRHLGEQGQE
jgi:hypothetical protein